MSHWIYSVIFTSLHLCGTLHSSSSATSPPAHSAPVLRIHSRSEDSVVFICEVTQGNRGFQFMLYRSREMVDHHEVQHGVEQVQFRVKINRENADKLFCCLYKDREGRYSAFSQYLQLKHHTVPTLVLDQRADVQHLVCTGSASHPGAVFFLYLEDSEHPITTLRAKSTHHEVTFQIPVQETPVASYQCGYSFMLDRKWSLSERSRSLPVTTDVKHLDWPLLVGSLTTVVLFLCAVVLVVVLTRRKVKSLAVKEKNREEEKFWTQIHAKDHTVDLTVRCSRFNSQEWSNEETEMSCRFPSWNSHSTFTTMNI